MTLCSETFSPPFLMFYLFPFTPRKRTEVPGLLGQWCTSIGGLLIVHPNSASSFCTFSADSLNDTAHHYKPMPVSEKNHCQYATLQDRVWVWAISFVSQVNSLVQTMRQVHPFCSLPLSSLFPPLCPGGLPTEELPVEWGGCKLRVRALEWPTAWWRRNGGLQQNRDT